MNTHWKRVGKSKKMLFCENRKCFVENDSPKQQKTEKREREKEAYAKAEYLLSRKRRRIGNFLEEAKQFKDSHLWKYLDSLSQKNIENALIQEQTSEIVRIIRDGKKVDQLSGQQQKLFVETNPITIIQELEKKYPKAERRNIFRIWTNILLRMDKMGGKNPQLLAFVRKYFNGEFLKHVLKEKRGKKLKQINGLIKRAHTTAINSATEQATNAGNTIETTAELTGEGPINIQAKKQGFEKMLEQIELLGDKNILAGAQRIVEEEKNSLSFSEIEIQKKLHEHVRMELKRKTEQAVQEGSISSLKEVLQSLEKFLSTEEIQTKYSCAIAEGGYPQNYELAKHAAKQKIQAYLNRMRMLLEKGQQQDSQALLETLLEESNNERSSNAIIACVEHLQKIEMEGDLKKAEYEAQIANETVEVHQKKTKPWQIEKIQKWATKNGIPPRILDSVIASFSTFPESDILQDKEFLRKALQEKNFTDTEIETIVKESTQQKKEVLSIFLEQNGSPHKTLAHLVGSIMEESLSFADIAFEEILGEQTPRAEMQGNIDRANASLEKFPPNIKENAARLRKFLEAIAHDNGGILPGKLYSIFRRVEFIEYLAEKQLETSDADVATADKYMQKSRLARLAEEASLWDEASIEKIPTELKKIEDELQKYTQYTSPSSPAERLKLQEDIENSEQEIIQKLILPFFDLKFNAGEITTEQQKDLLELKDSLYSRNIFVQNKSFTEEGVRALYIPKDNYFEIQISTQMYSELKWGTASPETLQIISHEVLHAIDFSSRNSTGENALSQELYETLKNTPAGKDLLRKFSKLLGKEHIEKKHRNWLQQKIGQTNKFHEQIELFAHLFAGHTNPAMIEVLEQIKSSLGEKFLEDFQKKIQNSAKNFSTKDIRAGEACASNVIAQQENKNIPRHNSLPFPLDQRKDDILRKLQGVRDSNMRGKNEFVKQIEDLVDKVEEDFKEGNFEFNSEEERKDVAMTRLDTLNDEAGSELKKVAEMQSGSESALQAIWNNTTFLSLADLGSMLTTIKDHVERKYKRQSDARAGTAGKVLFDKIYSPLAGEFDNKFQNAEEEEVGAYKKAINDLDAWQIMDRIERKVGKDELKACIEKLAEMGKIDWTDKRIWRAFEKHQGLIQFYDADKEDESIVKTKARRALNIIYDDDFFRDIDRQNTSARESRKDEFIELAKSNTAGAEKFKSMLVGKKKGENVEPQEYYGYIHYDIEGLVTDPITITWHIIQGVRLGLLNKEHLQRFDDSHQNHFAMIKWFGEKNPSMVYLKRIGEMYDFGDTGEMPESFKDWFYTNIMTSEQVLLRLTKTSDQVGGNKWDHDSAFAQGAIGNFKSAQNLLVINSGSGKNVTEDTAPPSMLMGQLQNVTTMARHEKSYGPGEIERQFAQHMEYAFSFSKMITGGFGSSKYYSIDPYKNNLVRQNSSYAGANTGAEFLERNNDILRAFDPKIYEILSRKMENQDQAKDAGRDFKNYILSAYHVAIEEDMDSPEEIFGNLSSIIRDVLATAPGKASMQRSFEKARERYKKDHNGKLNNEPIPYNKYANSNTNLPQSLYR